MYVGREDKGCVEHVGSERWNSILFLSMYSRRGYYYFCRGFVVVVDETTILPTVNMHIYKPWKKMHIHKDLQ